MDLLGHFLVGVEATLYFMRPIDWWQRIVWNLRSRSKSDCITSNIDNESFEICAAVRKRIYVSTVGTTASDKYLECYLLWPSLLVCVNYELYGYRSVTDTKNPKYGRRNTEHKLTHFINKPTHATVWSTISTRTKTNDPSFTKTYQWK